MVGNQVIDSALCRTCTPQEGYFLNLHVSGFSGILPMSHNFH